jgi:hypothetical protein
LGERVKIKTRESLKTIKTFDRADTLAQKSKKGVSSLHNSAEQTQNVGYESETDYAGSELQDKEEYIARTAVMGADRVGRWGARETRKNIQKWKNRPRKLKPNPKLKQLPSTQRKVLQVSKNGIKVASTGRKSVEKATVKGILKVARHIKKVTIAAAKYVKVAVKAIITATKAVVAALKGIIAAIVAGGWGAVLIIVIIVLVALIVGSVFAIFIPNEDDAITIYDVKAELEREYREKQTELIEGQQYDVISYEGCLAEWNEIIAVYAVKLNLDREAPQEVATFDENKAEVLKEIFWDMHSISSRTERKAIQGASREVTVLVISTATKSLEQISQEYQFNEQQRGMIDELLSEETEELWNEMLGSG